tara:strand:+ start:1842 stop:4775 length:2934 start_codon:yes stop_codon:yes gene_type:complete
MRSLIRLLFGLIGLTLAMTTVACRAEGPLAPARAAEAFQLADPALGVRLVLSEPDVQSPVAMAWDADGKLYVAEMIGYPITEGAGRIRRLEDRDGDGRYEHSTVFADRLSFPTSVLPHREGILVTAAPDILFLADSDGDGVADVRRAEWTGFGTGSQQLRANALRRGLDGWIYGANGRCGGIVHRPDHPESTGVDIHGRDFRFDPDMKSFEAIAGQSQFGQAHNDWGDRFLNWNTIPVRQVVVPPVYLNGRDDLRSLAVRDTAPAGASPQIFPISPPPAQFNGERADHYNALCGLTIFRDQALGDDYLNAAFVCESLTNLILHRKLTPEGAIFVSNHKNPRQAFLASSDPWFHPVFLATGPDGGLYVADFYRQYVEHPRYVASETARTQTEWQRGKERGRIWRIGRAHSAATGPAPRLSEATIAELVATLDHPNGWHRDTAQRLLIERADPASIRLLENAFPGAASAQGKLHTAWTLHRLGGCGRSIIEQMLGDHHSQVRRHGVRLAAMLPAADQAQIYPRLCGLAADPDAVVRFELALALAHPDNDPALSETEKAAEQIALRDYADRWIGEAVLAGPHLLPMIQAVTSGKQWRGTLDEAQMEFLVRAGRRLAALDAAQNRQLASLFASGLSDTARTLLLAGAAEAFDGDLPKLEALLTATEKRQTLEQSIFQEAIRLLSKLPNTQTAPAAVRVALVNLLIAAPAAQAEAIVRGILQTASSPLLLQAAAQALARGPTIESAAAIYSDWNTLSRESRRQILLAAPRTKVSRDALYAALQVGQLGAAEIPFAVAATLSRTGDVAERNRFAKILKTGTNTDRAAVLREFVAVDTLHGDPHRGGAVFNGQCQNCHAVLGTGGRVGPDLSGAGRQSTAELLKHILDPSHTIEPDYLQYEIATRDGKMRTGLIADESDTILALCDAQGKITAIQRSELNGMRALATSLMPEGVETKIGPQAMADLIAFLRNPSRQWLIDPEAQ